jgi:hypothetical protein
MDYTVSGDKFTCSLCWLERKCTSTVELPDIGVIVIPPNLVNLNSTVLIPNLQTRILPYA